MKKQTHIPLSFINQKKKKKKIFRDFQFFVLNPILKGENSEIMEILQKLKIYHHKELKYCSYDIKLKMIQVYC